jgi:nucleoside-diphosphate-sugar epimerase
MHVICAEMARILIVGCGCRGRELGRVLAAQGHAVRGTSRSDTGRAAIEAAGLDGVVADPDRLGTLLPALESVSVVVWLLAAVDEEALHGPRLESLLETLVDTPVRGFVYEGGAGEALVRRAADTWRIPVEIASGAALHRAVARVLATNAP